jgi:NAD+ kinase
MAEVALVVHHTRPAATDLALQALSWLHARGHVVRLPAGDAAVIGRPDLGREAGALGAGLDLAVSLGGDGTVLRTIDLLAPEGVPVLGVNVGQLGYLTEVEPADLKRSLAGFVDGTHRVEERMLLAVDLDAPSGGCGGGDGVTHHALNEAVLEKTPTGHTVRMAVSFDGEFFTRYAADGLIVATPTGSTAYSFSARGPIVAPTHRASLLTPVSAHMLFDRSLVLEPDTEIRLEVCGERPATLSVDGRNLGTLVEGDAVVCKASDRVARFVRFGQRDFHRILKTKFGLNDR